MKIIKKEISDVTILTPTENLVNWQSETLLNEVKKSISKNNKKVVINLFLAKQINSTGIGIIVACFTTLRDAGGILKLSGVTKKVINSLVTKKLANFFKFYKTEREAIKAFE